MLGAFSVIGAGTPKRWNRMDKLASRWYVRMIDAGMRKCEKDGRPLTDEQRFTLLTAGQLPIGDWRTPPGTDPQSS
jgi:hypothetical protein